MMLWLKHNSPWMTIVWAIFITTLSFLPGNYIPPLEWELVSPDTLAHVIFYTGFIFLFFLASSKTIPNLIIRFIGSFVLIFLHGYLIELIQGAYIPGRFFDPYDLVSNSIGEILGIILSLLIRRHIQ